MSLLKTFVSPLSLLTKPVKIFIVVVFPAGKTTTINILTGLVNKDSGETKVFNKDTEKDFRFTRSQIGISAQEFSQDWFFSLEKLLYFQAGYFGIRKKDASFFLIPKYPA